MFSFNMIWDRYATGISSPCKEPGGSQARGGGFQPPHLLGRTVSGSTAMRFSPPIFL
jgi:hypothetical protein